nr:hypothetical protein [Streptomyces sp. BHT-5-2]
MADLFDLTVRFYVDRGGHNKAEATFLRRGSGAKPRTSVTDYTLHLTGVPKAVEFNAQGMEGSIIGDRSGGDPTTYTSLKEWIADQRSGVSFSGWFGFRLSALGCVEGTNKPLRLVDAQQQTVGRATAAPYTVEETSAFHLRQVSVRTAQQGQQSVLRPAAEPGQAVVEVAVYRGHFGVRPALLDTAGGLPQRLGAHVDAGVCRESLFVRQASSSSVALRAFPAPRSTSSVDPAWRMISCP